MFLVGQLPTYYVALGLAQTTPKRKGSSAGLVGQVTTLTRGTDSLLHLSDGIPRFYEPI